MKRYLLIAALAGLGALLGAGITAGVSMDLAFNLRLVERVVCPPGQTLEYRELGQFTYTDSEGTHNAANISVSCLAADGTRVEGKGTATLSALIGLYFVVYFLPLLTAGVLFRWSLVRRSANRRR